MSLFKYDPKLVKHKGRYNVRFYFPETRRRKMHALGTDNKEIADRRFREIVRAYERGEFDPRREKYQFGSMTLRRAANDFLARRSRKADWSDRTYADYETFLNMVCAMLPADVHLRHVDPADCKKIIRRPPSRATQRGYYRRLRSFLNWCQGVGYLKVSPLEDVNEPRRVRDRRVPFLTRDEFARFVQAIGEAAALADEKAAQSSLLRLSRAVRFDVATGLRLSELRALRWRDADAESRRIHVVGKGDKYRTLPLFPDAEAVLDEIEAEHAGQFGVPPRPESEIFPGLPYYGTSHDVTHFLRETGLKEKIGKGKAVHVLRHTFASWCVMAGVDIYTVSKWLGHESVRTTEIYSHLAPGYAPDAAVKAFGGGGKSAEMVE